MTTTTTTTETKPLIEAHGGKTVTTAVTTIDDYVDAEMETVDEDIPNLQPQTFPLEK